MDQKGLVFIKFLPNKFKTQGMFKRGSHTHDGDHKGGICQSGSHTIKLPKIISRESIT